ncbi:MAG: zinc-binding dehydrogenase, partial [Myxococcales bacterium]|nr:zinc-binding dehydrogenase [Myxococcales bacterium]
LVHAAAGGTGLLCVQMAKRAGAMVIGTTSSEAKARAAREAGADHVINYAASDFAEEARRLTGGRGVDLILDSIGRKTVAPGLEALAPGGHLIMYGFASGSVKELNPMVLFNRGIKLSGMILGRLMEDAAANRRAAEELLGWVADGSVRVEIENVWPLEEAAEAHRAIESRKTSGKLLLRVSS